MINIAIAGFGNVGKALYQLAKNQPNVSLSHLFSSRKLNVEEKTYTYDQIEQAEKVDCILLGLSSHNQLPSLAKEFLKTTCTIDCFDDTDNFDNFKALQQLTAVEHNKVALCGCGWDPGIFDVARKLFLPLGKVETSWGKGTSCGHSNAVRNVDGVVDGVSWTIPTSIGHVRQVFVLANGDKKKIEQEIKNIPHYFSGLETNVVFVDKKQMDLIKKDFSHQGKVWFENTYHKGHLSFSMQDNPLFTATIMFNSIPLALDMYHKKAFGAYTLCDLPLKNFGNFTV